METSAAPNPQVLAVHLIAQVHAVPQTDSIQACPKEILQLLNENPELALKHADKMLRVWPFSKVETRWRRLYEDATLVLACSKIVDAGNEQNGEFSEGLLQEVVTLLDMAIIMTGAPCRNQEIRRLLDDLQRSLGQEHPRDEQTKGKDTVFNFYDSSYRMPRIRNHPGLRPSNIGEDSVPGRPYVLRDAIRHWPALADSSRRWARPAYFLQRTFGGRRLVPVEIGRSYTDAGWGQRIMPFAAFMDRWILKKEPSVPCDDGGCGEDGGESIAYLAQHDLLAQVPTLRDDIAVPDEVWEYMDDSQASEEDSASNAYGNDGKTRMTEPLINTWFGPAGTITPLHTDPYDNILCQVVGKKYIRLYSPKQTPRMFPRGRETQETQNPDGTMESREIDMSNTSSIPADVVEMGAAAAATMTTMEEVDKDMEVSDDGEFSKFEEFELAEYYDLVLSEGEALFIPRGWWHYVRSLTISISVSFWWD